MDRELSILVAEDDYLISEEIARVLRGLMYSNITKASDGKEAVELVCSTRPDIVIMDIQMPELDGISAAKQIQERCPTPVIILTAFESFELLRKSGAACVSAYLAKPPHPEEMERAITLALARHADLMEVRRLNKELEQALAEVKTLRGILPICSWCKKIRDDKGYWEQLEAYLTDHSEASFTHGVCPDCAEKLYKELDEFKKKRST